MYVHSATIVLDEPELLEAVHEEVDTRTCCTYHFGERLLANPRDNRFRFALLAEMSQQQKNPGQSFLAGIETAARPRVTRWSMPFSKTGLSALRQTVCSSAATDLKLPLKILPLLFATVKVAWWGP